MNCPICNSQNHPNASACQSCGSPLMTAAAPTTPANTILPVGTQLQGSTFAVGKMLGQGGFGITYLGSEVRLRRAVAIKEFFPQGCGRAGTTVQAGGTMTDQDYRTSRERFIDEARVLAQFTNPGIVHVYTFFEENNTAYMVMEYIKGKTLMRVAEEKGPLSETEVVPHIIKVGEALTAVHKANLLHRDIKPENIMITDDGRAILVDFGTAREFASGKTKKMTAMLTAGYAPLEQYGQAARFGPFTDVYALGATLYHMVTGRVPVYPTDRAGGVDLPSPRSIMPSVSMGVSDAVMWAMEMKVDKRPQSMPDFLAALQSVGAARLTAVAPAPIPRTAPPAPAVAARTAPQPYSPRTNALPTAVYPTSAPPALAPPPKPAPAMEKVEGMIRKMVVDEKGKNIHFFVRQGDRDVEVFTTSGYDPRFAGQSQAFLGETLQAVGGWQKGTFVAFEWKLRFGPAMPRHIAEKLLTERGLVTQKAFFDAMLFSDPLRLATLELAAQSTAEPTIFAADNGGQRHAFLVAWTAARSRNRHGEVCDRWGVLVDVEKVDNRTDARAAAARLLGKANEFVAEIGRKFSYKAKVIRMDK